MALGVHSGFIWVCAASGAALPVFAVFAYAVERDDMARAGHVVCY
jgi:hypothetical protein